MRVRISSGTLCIAILFVPVWLFILVMGSLILRGPDLRMMNFVAISIQYAAWALLVLVILSKQES